MSVFEEHGAFQVPVSRKMFKTMRCFRTHAQWKRMSGGGKAVRIVRIYLPQYLRPILLLSI